MKAAIIAFAVFALFVPQATAGVMVFDDVALKGEALMLKAETRGRIFARGGEMVEFLVDGKSLGSTLSGGDGVAYREFVPKRVGLYSITVKSGDETGEGHVLCLSPESAIVFVDVTGALFEGVFSRKPRLKSRETLEEIVKRHPVVYLNTLGAGSDYLGRWLRENGFPPSPLLPWGGGEVFYYLSEKGFMIRALVAGPEVVGSASEYGGEAFSFQEAEGATRVEGWDEVLEAIE